MVEKYHRNPMLGNDKAMQGDARAQYILSKEIYRTAKTLEDYRKVFFWLKKAADQGDAQAQYNLALMHEIEWQRVDSEISYDDKKRSEVYKQHFKSASYWLDMSAHQGFAKAEFQLGAKNYINFDIHGEEKYYKEALRWLKPSAEKGITGAQHYLGLLYDSNKISNLRDSEKATYWLNKAEDLCEVKEEFLLDEVFKVNFVPSNELDGRFTRERIDKCLKGDASACYIIARDHYGAVKSLNPNHSIGTRNQIERGLESTTKYIKKAYSCGLEAEKEWKKYELWKY